MVAGSRCRPRPCGCPHRHRRSRRSSRRTEWCAGSSYWRLPGHPPTWCRAAFAETWTVILEIKHDGMLARGKRRWSLPSEAFHVKKVVYKDWFALEQVETMATAAAPERIDHAFGTSL